MKATRRCVFVLGLTLAVLVFLSIATGQVGTPPGPDSFSGVSSPSVANAPLSFDAATNVGLNRLFDFQESDIKFSLNSLMKVLRDSRHEGWVLAAYPDPKTSRPLIGAGFSLDVATTEHLQRDPLNSRQFLEPSSAQLWEAAGLDSARLQTILEQFDRNLQKWGKKGYRRKIKMHTLPSQVTDEEATQLLRISAVQAIHNARAYCRNFNRLTAAQQMALSQLVFQMGVNLEDFVQFLTALNADGGTPDAVLVDVGADNGERWRAVQQTLIESQWARRYSSRAVTVIAMFDPNYLQDSKVAEARIQAVLRPPKHRHKKAPARSVRAASQGGALEGAESKGSLNTE